MLSRKHFRRRFERAAASFDASDFVHASTHDGLIARLAPLLLKSSTVVNLGAATGAANRDLQKRFKQADIVAIDIAHSMLKKARDKKSWLSKTTFAQAHAAALPFADESVDVIFSNLLLPWVSESAAVFSEVARVLRKGGVFAFATLGPDSLQEIARAWRASGGAAAAYRFPDMHDIGDAVVHAGLRDPVLDVDRLSVSYNDSASLFADLAAIGAQLAACRQRRAAMSATLDDAAIDGKITLELELVFGHCWGAGPKMDPSNYRIDASGIQVRRS